MRDPFVNYDSWLERPYQDMMEANDAFVDWAEGEGYDLDDPDEARKAEDDYEVYLEDLAEAEAEARYEAYMDRMEMEAWENDYYDDYDPIGDDY